MTSAAEEIAEFEEMLTAAILVDASAGGNAIDEVRSKITSRDFTLPAARRLFAAFEDIRDSGGVPDILPVVQHLRDSNGETVSTRYLRELAGKGLAHNIDYYVGKIVDRVCHERHRKFHADLGGLIDGGASRPELLEFIERFSTSLTGGISQSQIRNAYDIGQSVLANLRDAKQTGRERGIRTGIVPLDEHTNGLQPSTLTTIAARTSVGKSALGLQIADHACLAGYHVLYCSMEMSGEELMGRNVSNDCGIDSSLIAGCALDGSMVTDSELSEIAVSIERYREKHLLIWDPPSRSITVSDIRRRAKAMHIDRPLSLCVIDYIDLVKPADRQTGRRDIELGDIAKGLKSLATELKIPVVVLAQINRAGTNRDGSKNEAKPDLQHIADSDQVARDSDNVWILHRPRLDEPATSLLIRKQRGAPVCEIPLHMALPKTQFTEPPISSHTNFNKDLPSDQLDYDTLVRRD
ncbi:Replicative DNA helicase [Rosistilla oblonga]|uniref:replicative DNA helicase n=1 Tax=Rosistilla oblonga TaxID=2527990 RepID=UPI00118B197C|nr:replicative DNA helicase [Rosistilla oblonga]QDV11260.1 Replicative DNA helicase [Rosistilla oblonga]